MFHTVIEAGADGTVVEAPGAISKSPTSVVVLEKHLTHFNVHVLEDARMAAPWHNALQALAEQHAARHPGHDLDRPAARVHRERRGLVRRQGVLAVARAAGPGRAARRRRSCASSPTSPGRSTSRSASGPLCTPRSTSRPSPAGPARPERSGRTPDLVDRARRRPTSQGFQQEALGPDSVACTSQALPRRRPAEGRRGRPLPLRARAGLPRRAVRRPPRAVPGRSSRPAPRRSCPTTACRSGSRSTARRSRRSASATTRRSSPACCASSSATTASCVTDWELVNDNHVGDQVLPGPCLGGRAPRPAPADGAASSTPVPTSSGARSASTLLLDLVAQGRVSEARIDESARRLLDREVPARAVRRPLRRRGRGVAAPWAATTSAMPGTRRRPARSPCSPTAHGRRPGPSPARAGCAIYAENVSPGRGGAARRSRWTGRRTPTSRSCA